MDQAQLLALGKDLVLLMSPLIAQRAIQKIGENTTDATTGVLKRAWGLLQSHFKSSEAQSALTVYQSLPQSNDIQVLIAQQIVTNFQADQAAIAELQGLVRELRTATGAPPAQRTHTQTISGNAQVGAAIAGDVHGGLTVGPIDFSKKTIIAGPRARASAPNPISAAPPTRPPLPTTLSADGTHFTYGHALLIGIGAYQRDDLSVDSTATDAAGLAELLRDPQVAGYPATQVRVLVDAEATRDGILAALDAFAQQLANAPQATAVVFFAGHGKQRDTGYYLLPHDYTPTDVDGTAISAQEFHAKVATIRQRAQKLIVLLNCCHSGGVGDQVLDDTTSEATGDTPPADFYQPLVAGGGQVVISAARPWQKAGAASSAAPEHTVFGARLLDALRGQAPGDAAGIGVFELFSYLSTQVPVDAKQIIYKKAPLAQEPLLYAHQLDGNIAVALRPGWQGGMLDADFDDLIQQLAEVEVTLAQYASQEQAPEQLIVRRKELLDRLEHSRD